MKKIWLYYLVGAVALLLLMFPNLVVSDADAEIGPLQLRWIIVISVIYLLGIAFFFRHVLLSLIKRLPGAGDRLFVLVKQKACAHFERFWIFWISAVLIIFPLAPLFNINGGYYIDWYNHLWMIGYYGEYFSVHKAIPAVLNTQIVLIAYPTFYGYLLYAVLGLLSAYTGANIALRIGILVLWIMKFTLAYQTAQEFSKDKILSLSIGALICWEIYPLTNLYNRGAITEVFAAGLLTVLFYAGLLALYKHGVYQKAIYFILAGFAASLLGLSHPITAFFGFIFFGIIFLIFVLWNMLDVDRIDRIVSVPTLILGVIILSFYLLCVLSPWLYATITFKDSLTITSMINQTPVFMMDSIDNILVRFSPFPFDKRSLYDGIHVASYTPYLDAQVNVPLLILAIALIFNKQRSEPISILQINKKLGNTVFFAATVLFFVSTFMSLSPFLYKYISVFNNVQIAYRMVTYQNLSLVIAVMFLLLMQKHLNLSVNSMWIILAVCLTLAGNNVLMKFWHAKASADVVPQEIRYNVNPRNKADLLNIPPTFYGLYAYTLHPRPISNKLMKLPILPINLQLKKDSFGEIESGSFFAPEKMWVQTNIAFSPWNEVLIDGVPAQDLNDINNDQRIDVIVDPGKHHISARFAPNRAFQFLRRISNFSFVAWSCVTIVYLAFYLIRKFIFAAFAKG